MGFAEAVKKCLSNFATFSGRARRSEYWFFYLFFILVAIAAAIVDGVIGTYPLLYAIAVLALLIPMLAVTVRRLHDTSKSGWYLLVALIPLVGGIILLVWTVQDSHGPNEHGPSPKGAPMQEPGYSSTV